MATAASEAKATENDTSGVEAMLSADEETNAYERVLAVCENSITDYTNFLEANEESDDDTDVDASARISRTRMLKELALNFVKMSSECCLGYNIYCELICEDFEPYPVQKA